MAKRKSKSKRRIGAKPLAGSGEPGDPGYVLYKMQQSDLRFERSCRRNYEEFCAVIDAGFGEQLGAEAINGFEQAKKRRRGKRWPIFNKPAEDLPQAVCVMLMFGDIYQESQGQFDWDEDFVTQKIHVDYGKVVAELRDEVMDYYHGSQAREDMPDLFTRCMAQVKKRFRVTQEETVKPVAPATGPKPEPSSTTSLFDDDSQLSPSQIARQVGLPLGRVRKRLERKRKNDQTCFVEMQNRRKNEPQFLYYWGKVKGEFSQ